MEFHDTMLTVKEVQAIFGCGKRQAYELMRVSGFPVIKLGGKYLVSAKALEKWIQKNTGKAIMK